MKKLTVTNYHYYHYITTTHSFTVSNPSLVSIARGWFGSPMNSAQWFFQCTAAPAIVLLHSDYHSTSMQGETFIFRVECSTGIVTCVGGNIVRV
jgi:hypothetical protein